MDTKKVRIRVQQAYPRIYLACHNKHQNSRTTKDHISQRDAAILAHLDRKDPASQSALAQHLGINKSTMSEAIKKLISRRYIERVPCVQDDRNRLLRLTESGLDVMSRSSVLEPERLDRLIEQIDPADRGRAVEGLEILARAAVVMKRAP